MKSSLTTDTKELIASPSVPIFGYELIRDILIPDLLGKDTSEISYWAGKHLARKFQLSSFEEIHSFFQEAGWGELHILDEKRSELKLELNGPFVERRFQMNVAPCFRLEAGFIAQQYQMRKQVLTEAFDEQHKKQGKVVFIVRWDRKDSTTDE